MPTRLQRAKASPAQPGSARSATLRPQPRKLKKQAKLSKVSHFIYVPRLESETKERNPGMERRPAQRRRTVVCVQTNVPEYDDKGQIIRIKDIETTMLPRFSEDDELERSAADEAEGDAKVATPGECPPQAGSQPRSAAKKRSLPTRDGPRDESSNKKAEVKSAPQPATRT